VVLPTPPFWLATEIIRPIPLSAGADSSPTWLGSDGEVQGQDSSRERGRTRGLFHVKPDATNQRIKSLF
jgi:hypothetical protein